MLKRAVLVVARMARPNFAASALAAEFRRVHGGQGSAPGRIFGRFAWKIQPVGEIWRVGRENFARMENFARVRGEILPDGEFRRLRGFCKCTDSGNRRVRWSANLWILAARQVLAVLRMHGF